MTSTVTSVVTLFAAVILIITITTIAVAIAVMVMVMIVVVIDIVLIDRDASVHAATDSLANSCRVATSSNHRCGRNLRNENTIALGIGCNRV